MDPERWKRICAYFEAARGLRGPARDAVLASAADVAEEVRDLLREHDAEEGLLQEERPDPLLGRRIGPYRIERVLGRGGMATVYEATGPEGPVACKRLQPLLAREAVILERFRREAELGLRIRHPRVVRTRGLEGEDCLIMDLLPGETLRTVVRDLGHLSERRCVAIARQVAEGLAAIHAAGAVHRDLKPANLMQDEAGNITIMDLGIALPLDDMLRLSRTGEFIGTLRYAAPEHLGPSRPRSAPALDARADFYALGLVLYELASGAHPHPKTGLVRTMRAHLETAPPPLCSRAPHVGAAFEALTHRLLEKDPARRPAGAQDLLALLDAEPAWR